MKSLELMVPQSKWRSTRFGNPRRSAPLRRRKNLPRLQQLAFPATVSANSSPNATSTTYSPSPPPPMMISSDLQADSLDGPSTGPQAFEELIEKVIYRCRFLTMFGVVGSLMGSVLCFLKGCVYVMDSFTEYSLMGGGKVVLMLVEAIDIYLIGTVMLVFGMGLYELFISNLDIAKTSTDGSNLLGLFKLEERPEWLEIQSLNELKTKLGHVIVMVLLVGLFEKSKKVTISTPRDLLCFAASIFLLSGCLYLLSRLHTSKRSKQEPEI